LYAVLGPTVVAINLSAGLLLIPLAVSAARQGAERLGHAPAWRRLADTLSGRELERALEWLEELERFAGG
jgi:hypothetical protein